MLAAAAEVGLETRLVGPDDDQAGLDVLLAVGWQGSFMPVLARPKVCPRIVWVGEPLLDPRRKGGGAIASVARSRAMGWLRFPLRPLRYVPLPRPLARLRSEATAEREQARNLGQMNSLIGAVDHIAVTSRDRRAALAEQGIDARVVPFGYAPAVAGPLTPPSATHGS